MLSVLGDLPPQVGDDLRERWTANAAARRPADPVRRRVSEDRPIARSICSRRRSTSRRRWDSTAISPIRRPSEFPLALISPASERTISSTLGELSRPDVRLEMNPDDADARGIEDGDAIRVWNALGEMRINARVSALVQRGTVTMPKGVWRRNTKNGFTSNALSPDSLADLGGGACFNDARVQVREDGGCRTVK